MSAEGDSQRRSGRFDTNLKEGFLKKRGGSIKTWKVLGCCQKDVFNSIKDRFFVLKPDGFYYYKEPKVLFLVKHDCVTVVFLLDNTQDWTPVGVIPLKEVVAVEPVVDAEVDQQKLSAKGLYFFKIVTPKREYYISASSKEEREDWVKVGKEALKPK